MHSHCVAYYNTFLDQCVTDDSEKLVDFGQSKSLTFYLVASRADDLAYV